MTDTRKPSLFARLIETLLGPSVDRMPPNVHAITAETDTPHPAWSPNPNLDADISAAVARTVYRSERELADRLHAIERTEDRPELDRIDGIQRRLRPTTMLDRIPPTEPTPGQIKRLALVDRDYHCPKCGTTYAVKYGGRIECGRCGDEARRVCEAHRWLGFGQCPDCREEAQGMYHAGVQRAMTEKRQQEAEAAITYAKEAQALAGRRITGMVIDEEVPDPDAEAIATRPVISRIETFTMQKPRTIAKPDLLLLLHSARMSTLKSGDKDTADALGVAYDMAAELLAASRNARDYMPADTTASFALDTAIDNAEGRR